MNEVAEPAPDLSADPVGKPSSVVDDPQQSLIVADAPHGFTVANLVGAIIAKLDGLYRDLIAAKDDELAAKDDLIAELRRRAEQAEREIAALERERAGARPDEVARLRTANERLAAELRTLHAQVEAMEAALRERRAARRRTALPLPGGAAPAAEAPAADSGPSGGTAPAARPAERAGVAHAARTAERAGVAHASRRWTAGLVVLAITMVAGVVAIGQAVRPAALPHTSGAAARATLTHAVRHAAHLRASRGRAASAPGAGRRATSHWAPARGVAATAFVPIAGVPLIVRRVLGSGAGLLAPEQAVQLPSGEIAVVDTGNRRLVLLDSAGHLLRSARTGRLQQPAALVATGGSLYVLDAGRGAIERYDDTGRFVAEVIRTAILQGARSMSVDRSGRLYAAAPRLGGLVVLPRQGLILHQVIWPRGAAASGLIGPSAVAVGRNGTIYVLDSVNNRIEAITAAGSVLAQWPAPADDRRGSVPLLPLPDGRLLATDDAGALLVYAPDSTLPVFLRRLRLPGGEPQRLGLSGLATTSRGDLLATDTRGNRLLLVPMP